MALEAAFSVLRDRLDLLGSQLVDHLLWVTIESQPHEDVITDLQASTQSNHYLVGAMGDLITELAGLATETRAAIAEADGPPHLACSIRSLAECQGQFNQVAYLWWSELASYERIGELVDFGLEHGSAWIDWAENVKIEIDRCQELIFEVNGSLLQCWQEISERVNASPVFMQNTNLGQQQITLPGHREAA